MNAKNNVNQGRVIGLSIITVLCCSLHLITSVLRTHHNGLHAILKGGLRSFHCMVSRSKIQRFQIAKHHLICFISFDSKNQRKRDHYQFMFPKIEQLKRFLDI